MYNTMIRAFSQCVKTPECISLYNCMLSSGILPDKFTFPFLVRSCCRSFSDLVLGQQLHAHIIQFGLGFDVFIVNNTIYMYTSCGKMNYARRLFEECSRLIDVVSWTSLISGYLNYGELDTACLLFDQMPCKNIVTWNAMISGYARFGRTSYAKELFDKMPERDVASWSALISGYAKNGMCIEALRLFKEMIDAMVVPNESSLVSAVSACAQLQALEEGIWLHQYIKEIKFEINVTLGTALLDMYGKCGCIEKAVQVFNSMRISQKNILSWNSMISGLAFNGFGKQALLLFFKMQIEGPTPNETTFIAVLSACSHSGLIIEGGWIFKLMTEKYQIKPQVEHYGCVVDLLGRGGLIKEALEFIERMPVEPHLELWSALVGACRIHGDVGLGEEVGKCLIESEPHRSGRYALLCNIFAAAKRWDDVTMLRNLFKERKVLKAPGNSKV